MHPACDQVWEALTRLQHLQHLMTPENPLHAATKAAWLGAGVHGLLGSAQAALLASSQQDLNQGQGSSSHSLEAEVQGQGQGQGQGLLPGSDLFNTCVSFGSFSGTGGTAGSSCTAAQPQYMLPCLAHLRLTSHDCLSPATLLGPVACSGRGGSTAAVASSGRGGIGASGGTAAYIGPGCRVVIPQDFRFELADLHALLAHRGGFALEVWQPDAAGAVGGDALQVGGLMGGGVVAARWGGPWDRPGRQDHRTNQHKKCTRCWRL